MNWLVDTFLRDIDRLEKGISEIEVKYVAGM